MIIETKQNPLWRACLGKVAEMQEEGWRLKSRSTSYISEEGSKDADPELWPRMCVFTAYAPCDKEMAVAHVFHITARYGTYYQNRGQIQVKVEGPYEDSSDAYWLEQREHDNDPKRCWLVTPNYVHYVAVKDRVDHHDSAGYAGREFVFEFIVPGDYVKFAEAGLKVLLAGERDDWGGSKLYHNGGEAPRLYTRNLWHQGHIPPKHQHLWTPNVEIVPTGIDGRILPGPE